MSEATLEMPGAVANGGTDQAGPKSAFISAPSGVDTSAVRCALEGKGVRCFSADQIDLPGQNMPQILREAMAQADLVIAVVDDTPASNLVFLEVGFAQAMGKEVAVLLLADAPTSAWLTSGTPYFRYWPEVPGTLDFGLSQILKVPHRGAKAPPNPIRRTHPIGERADELLAQLRATEDEFREGDLERVIAQAIRASGVAAVSQGKVADQRIDLAVWSDDLSPWVNNPFPIELRVTLRKSDLNGALGGLARTMARGGMNWGLLIYVRADGDFDWPAAFPNIIAIPADEFLERLRSSSFGDLVRGLRNQRVHGGC
jgi:hypothetical protein